MADQPKSSKGTFLFFFLAIVFWGGLAATPFYFGFVQTEESKRSEAFSSDVESLRRTVLNLDEHLAALRDMRAADDSKPDDEFLARKDVISKETVTSLSQTGNLLMTVCQNDDKTRGLKKWAGQSVGQVAKAAVNLKAAYSELQSKYVAAHDRMLKDAESAASRLRAATGHLGADRVQAVLWQARAQILRNRAEFENLRATLLRDSAEALASPLVQLRRTLATMDAEKPAAALAEVSRQLEENAAAEAALQAAAQKLSSEIKSREERIVELDNASAQARVRMTELLAAGPPGGATNQQYAELSDEARKAEAESAALLNGTLEGGTSVESAVDGAPPAYEGGEPRPGVRDLKLRLEDVQSHLASLEQKRAALQSKQQGLNETASKIDAQQGGVAQQVETLIRQIDEILAEAGQRNETSGKAYDEALKALAAAAKSAKAAAGDVKNVVRTFPVSKGDGASTPAGDGDMEASMHCLSAEIAYQAALIDASRIESLRAEAATRARVASAAGREAATGPADEIDKIRTEALNQLAEAAKAYERAANLIGKSNVKLAEGSVSGKNYIWQVQVGQAAVNMLQGVLLADKPEEATAARDRAYKLLADAAKGREQNPLLAPAIDALQQLQLSAK